MEGVEAGARRGRVLAVVDGDARSASDVLSAAVGLADGRGRGLTLSWALEPGRLMRWVEPFLLAPLVMGDLCGAQAAAEELAHRATFVPESVDLETVVLPPGTAPALRAHIAGGRYGMLVARDALLWRWRLGPHLRRHGVAAVAVPAALRTVATAGRQLRV